MAGYLTESFLMQRLFVGERCCAQARCAPVVCRALSTEHAARHLICSQSVKDFVTGPERLLCHAVKYFIVYVKDLVSCNIKDG